MVSLAGITVAEAGNGHSGPMAAMGVAVLLVVLLILLAILLVGGALFDLAARREEDAESLEERIADAIRSTLGTLPVVILADFPGTRWSPLIIEISGTVPSRELRDAVCGVVTEEMSRVGRDFRIDDRMEVSALAYPQRQPAARRSA